MTRRRILSTALLASLALSNPLAAQRSATLDTAGMDRSVKPGDNFFDYANGTWLKDTEIPADRSSFGVGSILIDLTAKRTADLIQEAAQSKAAAGSESRMIGDYYASFMDSTEIDAAGLSPLKPTLDSIAAVHDGKSLATFLGSTLRADVDGFNATNFYTANLLGLWVAQDLDDPAHYSPFLLQGGLGMPDRSYYLDSSPAMATIRDKYKPHIAAMLSLAKVPDAQAKADAIMRLETKIATVHLSREVSGDVTKANNHWKRAEFGTKAPGLDWATYFAAAGLAKPARFVVWQPSAVTGISALTVSEPLDVWKSYLTFHALQAHAALLPHPFGDESFAFYGPVLSGAKKQRDRWRRAIVATNNALGFAVGRRYVAKYFPPAEKLRAQAMVANLITAFRQRINHLDWMSPATKKEAKAKLAVLRVGVGYPDKAPTYDGLEVKAGDAFGNAERADLYQYRRELEKLNKPVDRSEWVMTPQTVNAVNLPAMNAMNFPAAILQPPFFDPKRPLAMDYGAIGSIMGHEVSHSFDNQGALFDANGRLHNWWTPEDFKHFEGSAKALVRQYDAYKPFPDLAVKGQQTLGENIADVAGLSAAYDAYHQAMAGKQAPMVEGFTGDQQFFISFAQAWRQKSREPSLRNQILTDGHAPDEYRASTVRNLDPWYRAFAVKSGETLFLAPDVRVRVW